MRCEAMDTEYLRSFCAVAKSGSFTDAAKALNKSQSTISGHVVSLERMLGAQLLARTTRSCKLTPEGRELLKLSGPVLDAMDGIYENFAPSLLGGRVCVGVPDDNYLFPMLIDAIQDFMNRRPEVNVEITAGLASNQLDNLKEGHLDLAVVREVISDAHVPMLGRSKLRWIASPQFSPERNGTIPVAHITKPCSYFNAASKALADAQIAWKSAVACTNLQGVLAMVRSGLAIAAVLEDEDFEKSLLDHDLELPELPEFGLTIHFANEHPTMQEHLIAKAISRCFLSEGS